MKGWYRQQRNLSERPWYKDSVMVHLYTYLKERAYVADGRYEGKLIRRGSCPITRSEISEVTGISPKTLDRNLKKLISYGEIIVKGNNRFSIITVCDYDGFDDTESLFGTAVDTTNDTANDTTVDTADDTTLIYTKEGRRKNNNKLISYPYKQEREKKAEAYEIKERYNKEFKGILQPCIRLTMPTCLMVTECIRRFGKQTIDMVFEQVKQEPFSLGQNKTGFKANFQFIFDPKNFQQYLERCMLRREKKEQPKHEVKVQLPAREVETIDKYEAKSNLMTSGERKKNLIEMVEYVKNNPRSLSCTMLEEAYKSGELQRYGIDWKPTNK